MMLFGSQVNPVVFGANPVIPEQVEKKTNVKMDIDFRSVYASILHHWFNVNSDEINQILFDDFDILPILKSTADNENESSTDSLKLMPVYPNPIKNSAIINFKSNAERVSLKLYTIQGQSIRVLFDKSVDKGKHSVNFSREGLASGHYILILQSDSGKVSQKISIQ